MLENFITSLIHFLDGSKDQVILAILVLMISIFSLITLVLFFFTIYLRFYTSWKNIWESRMSVKWSRIFLKLIDEKINAREAFKSLKWTNTITYLLFLEKYIDMLKGREQEQLIILGRMSSKKLHSLLHSSKRKNRLYGIHLLAILHVEEQFMNVRFDLNDAETSLTAIRELAVTNDYKIKEELIKLLFSYNYVSPVYISNIIAEMGSDVIPILELIIRHRIDKPFENIVAIETLKILRHYNFLDLASFVLSTSKYPSIISACLSYIEKLGDEKFIDMVEPFFEYPNDSVRAAAARAYIAIVPLLDSGSIIKFFDDVSVQVAVSAANKLKDNKILPHIP
ncbi:MAG: hypothetical protein DRP93_02025, partial [Candidatus Neomarinimicrobiota bacterium]